MKTRIEIKAMGKPFYGGLFEVLIERGDAHSASVWGDECAMQNFLYDLPASLIRGRTAYLCDLYVSRVGRDRGQGGRLLDFTCSTYLSHGIRRALLLALSPDERQADLERFYLAHGWQHVGLDNRCGAPLFRWTC